MDGSAHLITVAVALAVAGVMFVEGNGPRWSESGHYFLAATLSLLAAANLFVYGNRDHFLEIGVNDFRTVWREPGRLFRKKRVWSFTLSLSDLDRTRSSQRRPLDRLRGIHRIYATNGDYIVLRRRAYCPEEVRRILNLLNVRE